MLNLPRARRAFHFASTSPRTMGAALVCGLFAAACSGSVETGLGDIMGDSGSSPAADSGHDPLPNGGDDAGVSNDATVPDDANGADANPDPTDTGPLDASTHADASTDAHADAHDGAVNPFCHPSPSNYDVPGNGCDDDGDGTADNAAPCDLGLASSDANAFVQALGLCQTATATDTKWGVLSATFTNGHTATTAPADAQHGILPKFGNVIVPREGAMLGVLSSGGAAENDTDTGPFFKGAKTGMQGFLGTGTTGDAPPGFPRAAPGCNTTVSSTVSDLINAKIQIRVPQNAQGFSFDFDFWSGEWPEYVCSEFNDQFVPLLTSKAFNGGTAANIAFDANGTAFGTDSAFFDRCTPNSTVSCSGVGGDAGAKVAACSGGVAELQGTGFQDPGVYCGAQTTSGGGATGWLTTSAPVQPGEVITLEFMIWDTGDGSYDSSVLLDHFAWVHDVAPTITTRATP